MTDPGTFDAEHDHDPAPTTLEVDGLSVALRRSGSGEPLLFLHGSYPLRRWLPLHTLLAERFDVILPDHPGFAGTPMGTGFRGFDDYVLHYDALLRAVDAGRVHLVGQGLGGRLAAHLATTYPSRFTTLTLLAPSGLRVEEEPLIDEFRLSPEMRRQALFNGRAEAHRAAWELEGGTADTVQEYADSTATALLTWTNRLDRALERRLPRIEAPTLVVAAQEDRLFGSAAERFAQLIPSAELVTATSTNAAPTSHAVHVEDPDLVAALITDHTTALQIA